MSTDQAPTTDEQVATEDTGHKGIGKERSLLNTVSLLIIASVALTAGLIYTRSVLLPFVLAVLLSYLVSPVVDVLQTRLKVPRPAAMVAAFLLIAVGVVVLALLLVTSIGGLADKQEIYEAKFVEIGSWFTGVAERFFPEVGKEEIVGSLGALPEKLGGWVGSAFGGVFSFFGTAFLVLVFVIYLILGHKPSEQRQGLWAEIDVRVRRYLSTKVATSAATGLLVWLVLWAIGLDLALVFGVMAFLLNFIPSVGSIIATVLPLPIALFQFDQPWRIALVLLLPLAIQMVVGNGIEPKLMGESLDLHPVTILLALIFWGLVWGPVGMLLATPITAVAKIVLGRFQTTRPVAEVLGGRLPQV
jgi:AI-2 transport protein TqsA